jgi:hypothetical protein
VKNTLKERYYFLFWEKITIFENKIINIIEIMNKDFRNFAVNH